MMRCIYVRLLLLLLSEAYCLTVPSRKCTNSPKLPERWVSSRRSMTALNLWSLNLNKNGGNPNPKKDDEDRDEEESDFPSWIDSLKQWPQFSTNGCDESKEASAKASSRYRGVNPLSNLINVEALLDMVMGVNETESNFPNLLAATDSLFRLTANDQASLSENAENNLSNVTTVEEFIAWEKWMDNIQKSLDPSPANSSQAEVQTAIESIKKATDSIVLANTSQAGLGKAAEFILKDATSRIEYLVTEASTAGASVQDLVARVSRALTSRGTNMEAVTNDIVKAAESVAKKQGLDVQQATERARQTTRYAVNLVSVANNLFGAGYARGGGVTVDAATLEDLAESRPLFADFKTARVVLPTEYPTVVKKGAEMGTLAGAIYQDTVPRCHSLGHSIVANGTVADVLWMVTDSIGYESDFTDTSTSDEAKNKPMFVRTITIRGFDASDETVDRERLLNTICTAAGEQMDATRPDVLFHSGLLSTSRQVYKDIKKYIDWASPSHKIVLNGHSIGGALSILVLFLMVCDRGEEYVRERVLRVYSHGSPPIAVLVDPATEEEMRKREKKLMSLIATGDEYHCELLDAFGLPSNMVYGYVQPWDPIVRFLSESDALYPLVDDLGKDGVTLYAGGPARSLRPITRTILQSWEGWPRFRDSWKGTNQKFRSVGIQHILLPEPLRYLNDRFVAVNIGVPPTDSIVRLASHDLLPALEATFPLDVFQISFIPQAVRSFVHHFYPAYDFTIANYAAKVLKKEAQSGKKKKVTTEGLIEKAENANGVNVTGSGSIGWGRIRVAND